MRMRRCHANQLAREIQRQKNEEARRLKPKRRSLLSFLLRLSSPCESGEIVATEIAALGQHRQDGVGYRWYGFPSCSVLPNRRQSKNL